MALLGLRCVCSVVVVIVVVVVVGVSRGRPVCVLMAQTFYSMIEWLLSHAALGLVVLHCVGGVARRAATMRAAAARLASSLSWLRRAAGLWRCLGCAVCVLWSW